MFKSVRDVLFAAALSFATVISPVQAKRPAIEIDTSFAVKETVFNNQHYSTGIELGVDTRISVPLDEKVLIVLREDNRFSFDDSFNSSISRTESDVVIGTGYFNTSFEIYGGLAVSTKTYDSRYGEGRVTGSQIGIGGEIGVRYDSEFFRGDLRGAIFDMSQNESLEEKEGGCWFKGEMTLLPKYEFAESRISLPIKIKYEQFQGDIYKIVEESLAYSLGFLMGHKNLSFGAFFKQQLSLQRPELEKSTSIGGMFRVIY